MLIWLLAHKRKEDMDVVSNKDDFLVSNRNLLKVEMISWKGIATHSSILAWRIPRTEEPGGLQFMGLKGAGQD